MNRLLRAMAVLLVTASIGLEARGQTVSLRYWKSIGNHGGSADELVAFRLDDDVYAATRDGLPDLRVIDDAGGETPYQVELETEHSIESTRQTFTFVVVSLHEADGKIEIHLRRPESPAVEHVDGLRIMSRQINFERTVQVAGSDDGEQWKPLVSDAAIFDYSRYMNVSHREVELPPNQFREFKLTISNAVDEKESALKEFTRSFRNGAEAERTDRIVVAREPFRIDKIEGWHNVLRQRVRRSVHETVTIPEFSVEQLPEQKQTIVTVQTRRQPLTGLAIVTRSRNYYRGVVVEALVVRQTKHDWQTVQAGNVFDFTLRELKRQQNAIHFAPRRESQYRLVIENHDNPPLAIDGIAAERPHQRVVFLAQPDRRYRVEYSSDTVGSPTYDTDRVFAALRNEDFQPIATSIGPQQVNETFIVETNLESSDPLNNWWFLGSAITLMVVLLSWILVRTSLKLEQAGLTDDDSPCER